MQMCTGLHHYGMLLVYGTHQPPVHFWFKFREDQKKKPLNAPKENFSARFEEKDGHLAQVEVNEMLGLVGDIAAEVPPHDAVPGGVVLLIKLLKDKQEEKRKENSSRTKVLTLMIAAAANSILVDFAMPSKILPHFSANMWKSQGTSKL